MALILFQTTYLTDRCFLGITVGADAEMSPRKPLTSAPFAIKAGNAQTIEGMTLNDITYEDADAVTAMGVKGGLNALNHDRYSNAEALGAMGAKGTGNSLNHDRYSNANAVTAIKSADGTGSGIDSDLLDGQHAAEIIDAAGDEVRTPIASVPFSINLSGSYYFTDNLTYTGSSGTAITVTADHVTIDMMGFTLTGPGKDSSLSFGINLQGGITNVTITNGTIREFSEYGIVDIDMPLGRGRDHRLIDLRVINNGLSGIWLSGGNHQIRGCTVQNNGSSGIHSGEGSLLVNNTRYLKL